MLNRTGELQVMPYPLCQPVGGYCCNKKNTGQEENDFAKYGVGVVLYFRFLVRRPATKLFIVQSLLFDWDSLV
jgi:hypothetical protein